MSIPSLHRFEEFGRLSDAEHAAVTALPGKERLIPRGGQISCEGDPVTGFFLLICGWASASHMLPDGSQQITKVHLPGDALGTPGMATSHRTESLTAITDAKVAEVKLADFGDLFITHPRIAARFMLSIQLERVALMDRLASIGRTSAEARVAGFLLDLRDRLMPLKVVTDDSFEIPLIQSQIGDVLGLTGVHVNRIMKSFAAKQLVQRTRRQYRLLDVPVLKRLAARPNRLPYPDQHWLPAGR